MTKLERKIHNKFIKHFDYVVVREIEHPQHKNEKIFEFAVIWKKVDRCRGMGGVFLIEDAQKVLDLKASAEAGRFTQISVEKNEYNETYIACELTDREEIFNRK